MDINLKHWNNFRNWKSKACWTTSKSNNICKDVPQKHVGLWRKSCYVCKGVVLQNELEQIRTLPPWTVLAGDTVHPDHLHQLFDAPLLVLYRRHNLLKLVKQSNLDFLYTRKQCTVEYLNVQESIIDGLSMFKKVCWDAIILIHV